MTFLCASPRCTALQNGFFQLSLGKAALYAEREMRLQGLHLSSLKCFLTAQSNCYPDIL